MRLDYEDFLRHRRLALWQENDPRRNARVARRCSTADAVADWVRVQHGAIPSIKSTYAEIAANAALVLIGVARALLDRQIATLEKNFVQEGGFTERLYRARTQQRRK